MKYLAIALACLALTGCGTLKLIPAGTNSGTNPLGSDPLGYNEESYNSIYYPQTYSLTVSALYMDKYEVTKAQWDAVRSWGLTNGYTDLSAGDGKAATHPVLMVNWYDAVKWCNARSEKEGRTPAYYTTAAKSTVYKTGQTNIDDNCVNWTNGYRLPTDAEWEYAARGGAASKRFPWSDSDEIQHARANYSSYYWYGYDTSPTRGFHPTYNDKVGPYTSPVGSFAANGYGLYDMAGNVAEWCWDWYPGYEGSCRVLRGGSWNHYAAIRCRVAYRDYVHPDYADYFTGFRAVLPPGSASAH